jgi:DNA helicase-2/ATP-dependent DNA helicase PcrA
LLPYVRLGEEPDVDEERRLFYVGMTRARHKLVLLHAAWRYLHGAQISQPRSRFVGDIEAALKEERASEARRAEKKQETPQLSLF